jgi:ABC-2 type transport system ATP-binding protein
MDKGKVIAEGSPEELKLLVREASAFTLTVANPETISLKPFEQIAGVKYVTLSDNALTITSDVHINNLPLVMAEALNQKIVFTAVHSDSPSLESVFLDLTGRSLRD